MNIPVKCPYCGEGCEVLENGTFSNHNLPTVFLGPFDFPAPVSDRSCEGSGRACIEPWNKQQYYTGAYA